MDEKYFYMEHILRGCSVLHSIVAFFMLLAYYHLKVLLLYNSSQYFPKSEDFLLEIRKRTFRISNSVKSFQNILLSRDSENNNRVRFGKSKFFKCFQPPLIAQNPIFSKTKIDIFPNILHELLKKQTCLLMQI